MKYFKIRAVVTVDVEMMVVAGSKAEAAEIFDRNLTITAGLVDVKANAFETLDDCIDDVQVHSVEEMK